MSCLVKYTRFNDFFAEWQPVHQSLLHPPHRLFHRTWPSYSLRSSLKKLRNFGGEPAFPLEIVQFCLAACEALELRKSPCHYSYKKLCNSSQQDCSMQKLCNSRWQSVALPINCAISLSSQPNSLPKNAHFFLPSE